MSEKNNRKFKYEFKCPYCSKTIRSDYFAQLKNNVTHHVLGKHVICEHPISESEQEKIMKKLDRMKRNN